MSSSSGEIWGTWTSGEHSGRRGLAFAVVDGALFTSAPDGTKMFGDPRAFSSDQGETGADLVERLIPLPSVASLRRGAVREALANVCLTAQRGWLESRVWDAPNAYLVDNGEGERGYVRFIGAECVGAVMGKDPFRQFDHRTALSAAPAGLQPELAAVCSLPFFRDWDDVERITAVFWSREGSIVGPERWADIYVYGAELFVSELADEASWKEDGPERYELADAAVAEISKIAPKVDLGLPVVLRQDEVAVLVPRDSRYRDDALEALLQGGAFVIE